LTDYFIQAKERNAATHAKAGVGKTKPKRVSLARNRKVRWVTFSHAHVLLANLRSYIANKRMKRNDNVDPESLVKSRNSKSGKKKQV